MQTGNNNTVKGSMTKDELEADALKYGIKMLAITIMVVVVSMASCSMMPEFIDAETAKVETAKTDGQVKISAQKHTAEMAKIAAIQKLIEDQKVDPVAARCAVEGWDDVFSKVCMATITGEKKESGKESGKVSISIKSK